MRVTNKGMLSFNPQIPKEWKSYAFTINFRGNIINVYKSQNNCKFSNESGNEITILVHNEEVKLPSKQLILISI